MKYHYQIPPRAHVNSDVVGEGLLAYDIDYTVSKPFTIKAGVVTDYNAAMTDVSNNHQHQQQSSVEVYPSIVLGFNREAMVLRYRENMMNMKIKKMIRYASRKANAETRPRIKGRYFLLKLPLSFVVVITSL
ncbi:hypothetical protein OSB04_023352 [Centaurea solstitialis]|uniref:CCT domain-containing protein n=1 Tax=Centaurea solstitialis TaxID=347529 RepID=A0AA38SJ15_9ASTR|nr:hypothetical protein OSB04_023352 [Centaurea solstitialis]